MKNILLFLAFLFVSGLIVGARYFVFSHKEASVESQPVPEKKTLLSGYDNAVWDWNPFDHGAEFFDALKTRGVTTAYMNIGDVVDLYEMADGEEKQKKMEDFNAKVRSYLILAKGNELAVHALAGGTNWGNASHRYFNRIVLDYVREFNTSNPETAFQGIQFDIEPYSQEGFNAKTSGDIFTQYLDTVEGITNAFISLQTESPQFGSMKLGFVTPYWFDGQDGNIQKVSWQGEEKYPFYYLLNRLNRVQNGYLAIMAYRNFADGSDGIIEHIQNEISFSQQYTPRIRIIVGQETSDVKPQKITYFGKPFNALVEEVKKIGLKFENFQNVAGFSFNNADSFLEMEW
ncbi:MAG: hypothetical protein IPL87_01990 [Candidatus Moraniibacteriota bacterium]|nr:MAG: hypothetical protein IPL87_01990 [Candidatus Moranbacteria bacterium]